MDKGWKSLYLTIIPGGSQWLGNRCLRALRSVKQLLASARMRASRPWWGSPYYRGKTMPREKLCVSPLSSLAQGHLFHASGEPASPAFTQLMAPAPAEKQQGRARAANTGCGRSGWAEASSALLETCLSRRVAVEYGGYYAIPLAACVAGF